MHWYCTALTKLCTNRHRKLSLVTDLLLYPVKCLMFMDCKDSSVWENIDSSTRQMTQIKVVHPSTCLWGNTTIVIRRREEIRPSDEKRERKTLMYRVTTAHWSTFSHEAILDSVIFLALRAEYENIPSFLGFITVPRVAWVKVTLL